MKKRSLKWSDPIFPIVFITLAFFALVDHAFAREASVEELPADSPYHDMANALSREVANRLGVPPFPELVLAGLYDNAQLADLLDIAIPSDTQVMAAALAVSNTGTDSRRWTPKREAPDPSDRIRMDTCAILLHIRFEVAPDLVKRVYLAHELTHCYQMALASNLSHFRDIPVWIREGSAEFAGEDVVRAGSPALPPYWNEYFGDDMPLFSRSYDAMGLFFHIKHRGVDPYPIIRDLIESYIDDRSALGWIRSAMGVRNFSTWPMSLSRQSVWGPDWNTNGLAITSTSSSAQPVSLSGTGASYSTTVDPGEKPLYAIEFPSDKVLRLDLTGFGGIRWKPGGADGLTEYFQDRSQASYCAEGGCRCPDGTLPPGVTEVPSTGSGLTRAVLAITGDGGAARFAANIIDPPPCPTSHGSCKLLIVTNEESKEARKALCGRDLTEDDCIVGLWRADSEVYAQQIKSRLPAQMKVVEARNDTLLSIVEPGKADACINFETRTEMDGPVSLSTSTFADGTSISVLGLKSDNVLCAQPVKEEVDAKAVTNIGGVETEQPVPINTKQFARESRFECSSDRLRIYGFGDQFSEFIRIQ